MKKAGKIIVNGVYFDYPRRTLQEAIQEAGKYGVVEIEGLVYTKPIDNIGDINIVGLDDNAEIRLQKFYYKDIRNRVDLLTVRGNDVEISNLKLDARLHVDFALRLFNGCDNVVVMNVEAKGGTRGSINVLTSGRIFFSNVRAYGSVQGGFYFDALDARNIWFRDCTASALRTGVLIRNTYGHVANLNVPGITTKSMGIENRRAGIINRSGEVGLIHILRPPRNEHGAKIDLSTAKFKLNTDSIAYSHHRFYAQKPFGFASKRINRYGMDIVVKYFSFLTKWFDK